MKRRKLVIRVQAASHVQVVELVPSFVASSFRHRSFQEEGRRRVWMQGTTLYVPSIAIVLLALHFVACFTISSASTAFLAEAFIIDCALSKPCANSRYCSGQGVALSDLSTASLLLSSFYGANPRSNNELKGFVPSLIPEPHIGNRRLNAFSLLARGGRRRADESDEAQPTDESGSYDPDKLPIDGATEAQLANTMVAQQVEKSGDSKPSSIDLPDEISNSFMQYALSIILGRALPDGRDGLKPVHRRILYAMNGLNLGPTSGHRKCARVVGEVLGKFHPHGDVAVYDALVRMAQTFATGTPLVDGHGNFGSVDNDPPAAMRYTECRLTRVASEAMLDDLSYDTVDYIPNFDGNEREPTVLPAKLPFLLLNGSSGIAVGMATNIPPHNLGELLDACVALLEAQDGLRKGGELTDKELFTFVPAPDFPTGGIILGRSSSQTLYKTGHGGVIMRAKTHMEDMKNSGTGKTTKKRGSKGSMSSSASDRTAIVVTELPYQVNKSALLEKVASLVNDKKLEGIADLRDESDRDGIRVVFELKRDAVPAVVLNNLYQKTPLQSTFSGNFLALMNSYKPKDSESRGVSSSSSSLKPERFTLRSSLECFLRFRFETIRRKTQYQLSKEASRAHIVQGLLKALDNIDDVIDTIRSAPDMATARSILTGGSAEEVDNGEGLSSSLKLSKDQADAVLKLQLGQLTRLNKGKLTNELTALRESLEKLQELMNDDATVRKVMREEFSMAKQRYAVPRRSAILEDGDAKNAILSEVDLVENSKSVIVVTRGGYMKRMPLSGFDSQRRGTRGKRGAAAASASTNVAEEQQHDAEVQHCVTCNDHDTLLVMTNRGVAFGIRAFQVPQASRTARGSPIPSVLAGLKMEDGIASILPVTEFSSDEEHIVLATLKGWIKKTPLSQFANLTSRGLIIAAVEKGDRLTWCKRCTDEDDILIGTKGGMATRFDAATLRPTGRTSRGVKSMKLKEGDTLTDLSILSSISTLSEEDEGLSNDSNNQEYVLAVTANGYGKRVRTSEFRTTARGGSGVIATKFKQLQTKKSQGTKGSGGKNSSSQEEDYVSCLRIVKEQDDVLLVTEQGIIVRQKVSNIPVQGRAATGVVLQKVDVKGGDSIRSVSVVAPIAE